MTDKQKTQGLSYVAVVGVNSTFGPDIPTLTLMVLSVTEVINNLSV